RFCCLSDCCRGEQQDEKYGLVNLAQSCNPLGQYSLLYLLERTMQYIILTRNAESHVVIMRIAIRKSTARHARNSLAYQHLIEVDGIAKSFRDARPNIERGARVVNREPGLSQCVDGCLSFRHEFVVQRGIVIRVR